MASRLLEYEVWNCITNDSWRGGPLLPIHGLDHFADGILQALHTCAHNEFRLTVELLLGVELHCAESCFVISLGSRFKFAVGRHLTLKQFGLRQRNAWSRWGAPRRRHNAVVGC